MATRGSVERYAGVEMNGSAGEVGGEVVVVVGAGLVVEGGGAVDGVVGGDGAVVVGAVVVVGGCPPGVSGTAHPATPSASMTPTVHVRMSRASPIPNSHQSLQRKRLSGRKGFAPGRRPVRARRRPTAGA
jgi:hypothetical protein